MSIRTPAASLLLAALSAGSLAAQGGGAPTQAAITPADLRARLGIVAHDSMGGRDTGSPGLKKTADYIVSEMRRLGLKPAGDDGTFFDAVVLERTRYVLDASLTPAAGGAPRAPTAQEIVSVSGIGGLPGNARTSGQGPILFGGYVADGAVLPEEELTPAQLEGGVLIVRLGAAPDGGNRLRYSLPSLVGPQSKLSAVFLVAEDQLAEFWDYAAELSRQGGLAKPTGAPQGGGGPAIFLARREFVEGVLGRPLDQTRKPVAGLGTFRYATSETRSPVEAFNVVALLPGRDPARAGEHVAIGSHYDHVGIGLAEEGDSLYNGADDDGSGTTAMMEIAERLATLPAAERPARSVLFVWHTAEEKGLLGSDQFTENPTVPRESIVAQLNIDMLGRNSPDSVFLVGSRRLSTELGDLVEAVNARQPKPFAFDYSFDVPNHPEHIYCRSDHYNYARYGIPVTFFTTGLHPQYHKPSDEVELIDYDKLSRLTQLISDVTLRLATLPARPKVDKPVPALGTPCT